MFVEYVIIEPTEIRNNSVYRWRTVRTVWLSPQESIDWEEIGKRKVPTGREVYQAERPE